MRKCLLYIAALPLFHLIPCLLTGQNLPKICNIPAVMTKTCIDACLICDIDGFTGINNPDGQGQLPPGFCTTINHNIRWIAFMASTPDLTLEVRAYNCRTGSGLEIGIFESLDCKTIQQVSNCDTDVRNGETVRLKFTKKIVEGQYYYLVIDGNQGDVCTYSVKVVEGSTKVTPLDKSGDITGDLDVCQGTKSTYNVSFIKGATWHFWYLNGKPLGSGNTKEIDWQQAGTYQLCAQAVNACDDAPPNCVNIKVKPTPKNKIQASICNNEVYSIGNNNFSTSGKYSVTLTSLNGCDSIIELDLQVSKDTITYQDLRLCEGDTIHLGSKKYFMPGFYLDTLQNINGCDSIVDISLTAVRCLITTVISTEPSKCYGDSTGKLVFYVTDGTAPFYYIYENINNPSINGIGQINQLNQQISIPNLPLGDYKVTISDFLGNQRFIILKITEPPKLTYTIDVPPAAPFSLLCPGDATGFIDAQVQGGTPPYQYFWSNGENSPSIYNLSAGNYELIVRDKNDCPVFIKAEITEPPPLQYNIDQKNPSCDGKEGGTATFGALDGGVPPYKFSINNGPLQDNWQFRDLSAGNYTLTIVDANKCSKQSSISLQNPVLSELQKIQDYTINLGDSVQFQIDYKQLPPSINWYPPDSLSCQDCINPYAFPITDTYYTLYTFSKDGCPDSLKILVRVLKDKRIWAPNVFSPNSDGINDKFKIFGTDQVSEVSRLQIYSRWGELVYENFNFDIHDNTQGWNGEFRGKAMNPGVFVFVGEVRFADNSFETISGDFTLLR